MDESLWMLIGGLVVVIVFLMKGKSVKEEKNLKEGISSGMNSIFKEKMLPELRLVMNSTTIGVESASKTVKDKMGDVEDKVREMEKKVLVMIETDKVTRQSLSKELHEAAKQLQDSAKDNKDFALTLKGNPHAIGKLGEQALESILDISQYSKGIEFFIKPKVEFPDGSSNLPDFAIKQTGGKWIFVDSKFSLDSVVLYHKAESKVEKDKLALEVAKKVRERITELAARKYHEATRIVSPKEIKVNPLDYVIMFVASESAYQIALEANPDLIKYQMDSNVLIATPSSIMTMLFTNSFMLKGEKRGDHYLEISQLGGELYHDLSGMVENVIECCEHINKAKISLDSFFKKLNRGENSVIKKAEKLNALGGYATEEISDTKGFDKLDKKIA